MKYRLFTLPEIDKEKVIENYKIPIKDIKILEFIKHHKLNQNMFYNAQGKGIGEIENEMRYVGAIFSYNAKPCEKGRHTLRDRNNHCIVCRTANIAFQKRYNKSGYFYIAGSLAGKLIKIGIADGINSRAKSLNSTGYGNFKDWEILYYIYSNRVGLLEYLTSCKLSSYSVSFNYNHDTKNHDTKEIYYCSFKKAHEALIETKLKSDYFRTKEERIFDFKIPKYNFRNLYLSKRYPAY